MKVAQINYIYNSGSIGRIAHDLHSQLTAEGHESHVFCAVDNTHSPECSAYINKFILRLSQIENRLLGNQGFGRITKTAELISDLEAYQPDVIHLHNLHAFYMNCEMLFDSLKKYGKPVVWTFHDCWPFTGHCAYFDAIGCEKWKVQCHSCPCHMNAYPNSLVDCSSKSYEKKKRVFNSISNLTIVTPSAWLANLVKESFLSSHNVTVINNGIDLSRFQLLNKGELKKKYGFENKKILLGVSSMGFHGRKGLNAFIDLSHIITDEYQLVLIGADKQDQKRLPKNVVAMGRTESIPQLNEFYSMADFFLNPTSEDNFPTTNIESLACGTPVITYPTGGSPEPIAKDCGVVTKYSTADAILDAILHYPSIDNQADICRTQAEEFYSKELFAAKYIDLYKSVLQKH